MAYLWEGLVSAVHLILGGDPEFWGIVLRSVAVSGLATVLAAVLMFPLSVQLGLSSFRGEKTVSKILGTLMSVPSILIGLLVCLFLSRRGPLGSLSLLYTKPAMVFAQMLLVSPLLLGLAYPAVKGKGRMIRETAQTLGAGRRQVLAAVLREMRGDFLVFFTSAFGRAFSEVGSVMMVGGNIRGQTRVITTAISLENSMGDYSMSIALGLVLLAAALALNWIVYSFKERSGDESRD
ncbi:ABC transporter permease [Agathobaculum sp.]|uniref:ABC transporter permease n=1 Tax=Agathobaculum sp. TaxID=2048138 RepID=UPI002A7FA61D|nr:ABC transporter permease [Agathobaculum sp.]MDY3618688.1 ABC transporter permease [Agathobaculum sp.]